MPCHGSYILSVWQTKYLIIQFLYFINYLLITGIYTSFNINNLSWYLQVSILCYKQQITYLRIYFYTVEGVAIIE